VTAPTTLFRPYDKLVKITLLERVVEVPENNTLLRCLQFLAPESVSYGRFCWNEDCQYCRVSYDLGEGTPVRAALACKVLVAEGMRVKEVTTEIKYCLRGMKK
jgi:predicted molibdopterin-dependent oxidoreductase YjgC